LLRRFVLAPELKIGKARRFIAAKDEAGIGAREVLRPRGTPIPESPFIDSSSLDQKHRLKRFRPQKRRFFSESRAAKS